MAGAGDNLVKQYPPATHQFLEVPLSAGPLIGGRPLIAGESGIKFAIDRVINWFTFHLSALSSGLLFVFTMSTELVPASKVLSSPASITAIVSRAAIRAISATKGEDGPVWRATCGISGTSAAVGRRAQESFRYRFVRETRHSQQSPRVTTVLRKARPTTGTSVAPAIIPS